MSLKKQAFGGVLWAYAQQFGNQIIAFVVSIILARLLDAREFGLIGMITIFISIGGALFEGGLTSSLIRTYIPKESDYSTVFLFNLAASIFVYLLLFLCAPYIAFFFHQPILCNIIRVYSFSFILSALGAVQNTILTKRMQFRKQSFITLPALVIGSIIGIVLAYSGFGVWALVYSYLINSFLTSLFLWVFSEWRPKFIFSKIRFRYHFRYGYKLTISSVLDILFTNSYQIIIGRVYSAGQVGYYTRANTLMMLPVANVASALNKVVFPLFSKVQNDAEQLRNAYKMIMQMVLFIVTPVIVLMAVEIEEIVKVLFGEKWVPVVPIFQIICFTGVLYPIHLYNLIVLQVKGRSDLMLKLEIAKKVIMTVVIGISFYFGFYGLLVGQLLFSIIALLINTYYAGRMINYPMMRQLIDILPIFLIALAMAFLCFMLNEALFKFSDTAKLAIVSLTGFVSYLTFAYISKNSSLLELKKLVSRKAT